MYIRTKMNVSINFKVINTLKGSKNIFKKEEKKSFEQMGLNLDVLTKPQLPIKQMSNDNIDRNIIDSLKS